MDFESIEYADFSTRAGGRRVAEVRTREEVALVLELVAMGRNDCEIAREAGIPRSTVRQWRKGQTPDFDRRYTLRGRTVSLVGVPVLSVAVIR
jgi:transposase-like protein